MQLNEIVPWGRTLQEYQWMFDLTEADLTRQILGCGDGPASFNAEMTARGYSVTSIDPIYQFSAPQIEQQVQATYSTIVSQVEHYRHRYVWKHFRDADDLGRARLAAMNLFLSDYEMGRETQRYLAQSLPSLAFESDRFDLCVCSHLLFLYSEHLSLDFHLASISELLRVAPELRIFPLIKLDCDRSPYLEPVLQYFGDRGFNLQVKPVAYEFQKGGDRMLTIKRAIGSN
jgi:SAM-dependent methyltransferase